MALQLSGALGAEVVLTPGVAEPGVQVGCERDMGVSHRGAAQAACEKSCASEPCVALWLHLPCGTELPAVSGRFLDNTTMPR